METSFHVPDRVRERTGRPVRADVLQEMVRLTGGQLIDASNGDRAFEGISKLPPKEPNMRRVRLWCHPLWVLSVLLTLTLLWISRRRMGVV